MSPCPFGYSPMARNKLNPQMWRRCEPLQQHMHYMQQLLANQMENMMTKIRGYDTVL